MAEKALDRIEKPSIERVAKARQHALAAIDDQFKVGESVRTLQGLMKSVTDKELSADTVNAACNCVSQINSTLKTTIMAAKFLADR